VIPDQPAGHSLHPGSLSDPAAVPTVSEYFPKAQAKHATPDAVGVDESFPTYPRGHATQKDDAFDVM
jgi:hypothetical protein